MKKEVKWFPAKPADLHGSRALSERDQRIIALVAQGLRNSEIAEVLSSTEGSIKTRLTIIFDKVGVWSRLELALWHKHQQSKLSPESVVGTQQETTEQ